MRKYLKTTIFVTIILTLVLVYGGKRLLGKATGPADESLIVRIEQVEPGELQEFISAPGQIEPKTKVDISAKVSARVIELPYEEGERVTAGDPNAAPPIPPSVLIRLDAKDLESRLRSAEARYAAQEVQLEVDKAQLAAQKAGLKGTEATLEQAQRDFERQSQLLKSKDISQSDFDQSRQRLEELQAQYEASRHNLKAQELGLVVAEHNLEAQLAQVEEARDALEYTVIRAPIDGVITRINAEVGEVVMTGTMNNPGTVIMRVADLSKMLLVAQVDEADVGKIAVGQKAVVRVQAYWEEEFRGVVDTIALTHDLSQSGTKYFKTEILLQGDVSRLYSGLTADVDIYTKDHKDVIKVPSQAVLGRKVDDIPLEIRENNPNVDMNKTDAMVVYRVVDGKSVITPVTIGPSDLTHIIIEDGLSKGDKVIVGPYKILETLSHDKPVKDEKEAQKEKEAEEAKKREAEKQKEMEGQPKPATEGEKDAVDDTSASDSDGPSEDAQ